MTDETEKDIERLNTPGVVVEVDQKTSEELGAFEEDAMSEEEALESAQE